VAEGEGEIVVAGVVFVAGGLAVGDGRGVSLTDADADADADGDAVLAAVGDGELRVDAGVAVEGALLLRSDGVGVGVVRTPTMFCTGSWS
jgi:hypothetical protein